MNQATNYEGLYFLMGDELSICRIGKQTPNGNYLLHRMNEQHSFMQADADHLASYEWWFATLDGAMSFVTQQTNGVL